VLIIFCGSALFDQTLKRGRRRCASAHFLYIGNMDRTVNGFNTTGVIFGCLNGFLDGTAAFDDDAALFGVHLEHGTALAFVIACDDFDLVTFFDVGLDAAHEIRG